MSFNIPQTPQRPLPGAYLQTPARNPSQSTQSQSQQQPTNQSQALTQTQGNGSVITRGSNDLEPVERASKVVNDALVRETQYPELDSYVSQGISSNYDISPQAAWAPFQRIRIYDVPERVFEQYNRAQLSTSMGLFADLNHAWISIDNALYLWDYTQPDPPLIGFEEQPKQITAIKLVYPRAGVFVATISRLLVIATTTEIYLVGLASQPAVTGGQSVQIYSTGMQINTKGIEVSVIAGSAATGRIFFAGKDSNDVHELTYQQEERWFQGRCGKINHTGTGIGAFSPVQLPGFSSKQPQEHVEHMVIDDSRNLLYTLSSRSTIRVFHMTANNGLSLAITKSLHNILQDISHMQNALSQLLKTQPSIIAIDPISSQEGRNWYLLATTSAGCRIFLSATSSRIYGPGSSNAPNSMQVQHVKFPPSDPSQPPQQQDLSQPAPYIANSTVSTLSSSLTATRKARRFAPGYNLCFVQKNDRSPAQTVLLTAPDSGQIARPPDSSRASRFPELGMWFNLGAAAEDVGSVTAPFSAASTPQGFANELAVQYDQPAAVLAIMTNGGIHTYRRRRLVDILASTIRVGGGDEALDMEIKKFIRRYGRGETASTTLAVACGQGLDVTSDARVANITDPEVLEFARKAFIEHGGKPQFLENNVVDHSVPAIDMVHPSPRHEGLSLYVARLVRSIWKVPILKEGISPTAGFVVISTVALVKLRSISQDLLKLKEFLNTNKSFIDGLSGPDALGRASTKQEEISLQAEHRALHSQVLLVNSIIEGIAFVQVFFDERVEDIILSLSPDVRQQVRTLTFEALFSTGTGRDLAKELVKAIVNRNIASGSNVETVAEALRRRCGSFCSADDVVIFKAQEQLKRSSEAGGDSELGRNLLNESLRLFTEVASSLSMEQLLWAVTSFTNMQFYAGAIQLALTVAHEKDRGNSALSWIEDGRPNNDPRIVSFEARKKCYNLIHEVITTIEDTAPNVADGPYSLNARRRTEAYEVIDTSEDEAFQTDLYDWYLLQQKKDRLLDIQSPYIVTYLERRSSDSVEISDLLWRYHSRVGHNHQAASVQLDLARSPFDLTLDNRIEYLGRAKANASMPSPGVPRQNRYQLLREVSDLLDIANIQSDLLQRLTNDPRVGADRLPSLVQELSGSLLPMNTLYNQYADQAGYFDLCILIYQAADHRNPADIRLTWNNLIQTTHEDAVDQQERISQAPKPYEVVIEKARSLGTRLNLSETMFPIPDLLPMLERYAYTQQRDQGPETWVVDTLVEIGVPHESLFPVLEGMFYNDEQPFHGRNRRVIANDIVYVVKLWFQETTRGKGKVLGGEQNMAAVSQTLLMLQQNGGLEGSRAEECAGLRVRIEHLLR
ncbi:uncharacterized protein KY384_003311 [Bacidia gigantensis]|uniref:uncharacterized protein n=1 Tax=Bacidia gigantensis TaxID=2732470 RepID=UPI001D054714|nr:uncharacterized protein KY384_003311 [Bacidia gigantensis]KAG8531679.1 hypothetical protein KY384_003311 [Bacidia gigantensis]